MNILDARSFLFVPGDRPERFDKAAASGADVVVIDLEDAVAAENKRPALENAVAWVAAGHEGLVRVNGPGTQWHDAEIDELAGTRAPILVPKAESPEDLAALGAVLGDRVIALVETARGIRAADDVAEAPGVVRLALGNVDLSAELGVDPASQAALAYARGRLVAASAAAGLAAPIDGVTTALDSVEVLLSDVAASRTLGFGAKLCIHPRQVAAVNDGLRPSDDELDWARRVLQVAGPGVGVVDGAMVDAPVVARATRIVSLRAEAPDPTDA